MYLRVRRGILQKRRAALYIFFPQLEGRTWMDCACVLWSYHRNLRTSCRSLVPLHIQTIFGSKISKSQYLLCKNLKLFPTYAVLAIINLRFFLPLCISLLSVHLIEPSFLFLQGTWQVIRPTPRWLWSHIILIDNLEKTLISRKKIGVTTTLKLALTEFSCPVVRVTSNY